MGRGFLNHCAVYLGCYGVVFGKKENAESLEVLAPAHFLKGSSYTKFPEPDITHLREGRLSRWQRVTQMQQHFWKRWSSEYLSTLQERSKWRVETSNIKVGSIVLLKEDNVPPLRWQLGCIQEVIPGGKAVAYLFSNYFVSLQMSI
ncbi:uncharacterized protein [Drosophila suzukii]|uniref:Uncharacterized protein isoform X2 n=1 Tax=Drosophila suzukii TaxID=28584 RepID=A0ABM4TYP4_DROSZ